MLPLPIDRYLPMVADVLPSARVVIVAAPPGSGKSTRVAPDLVARGICTTQRKAFLLQPRRVAARSVAERIAAERNWELGKLVGYQVRFESRVGPETALIVATEGILLRRLQSDTELADVGTVILDEFHERSLAGDLLLGMLQRIQGVLRDDLKLVLMSATLDVASLRSHFADAPVIQVEGTQFPVDIAHRAIPPRERMVDHITSVIIEQWHDGEGDILVFLPGVGEIRQVRQRLERHLGPRIEGHIFSLHGSLPLAEQSRILQAGERRRLILATNVAETSLTIDGIRTVIDSGEVRVVRFDPQVGLDRLQLEKICRSSATQRAGRAGRLAAGKCVRLWDIGTDRARPDQLEPEIQRVDLSSAVLQLLHWGESLEGDFPWLDPPRTESLHAAYKLLCHLGAVSGRQLTQLGKRLVAIPVAPRLARLLLEGHRLGILQEAALAASLLSERSPFLDHARDRTSMRGVESPPNCGFHWECDIVQRIETLLAYRSRGNEQGTSPPNSTGQRRSLSSWTPFGEIQGQAARSLFEVAEQLAKMTIQELGPVSASGPEPVHEAIPRVLLTAFPDRLARRRGPGDSRGIMVGGRGVQLSPQSGVLLPEFFLCVDVDGAARDAVVRLASGIQPAWLDPSSIKERDELFFHPSLEQIVARRRRYWLDLQLSETPTPVADSEQASQLLIKAATSHLTRCVPDHESPMGQYVLRLEFLRQWAPELDLPPWNEALQAELIQELAQGKRSLAELKSGPWLEYLRNRLTPRQCQAIDREAPERMAVPSGHSIRLQYRVGEPPILAVRIQEVFAWKSTPRIALGRVPVLLHLLAPNMRPQQITNDLASFWKTTYHVVRKELRRRYPKHAWPEEV